MIRQTTAALLIAASATTFAQTAAGSGSQTRTPAPAPSAAQGNAPAVPRGYAPFQGTWVLTLPSGESMVPGGELAITITGDKYAQAINGTVDERGTMKIDTTKTPMWLDLTITEGRDAGKLQLGLVQIKEGVMSGALAGPGDPTRPASLTQDGVTQFVAKKKVAK